MPLTDEYQRRQKRGEGITLGGRMLLQRADVVHKKMGLSPLLD